MSVAVSHVHLLVLALLLLCSSRSLANTRTCFTQLQFVHGTSPSVTYADIADDEHSGFNIGCKEAEILCWTQMISHVQESLGVGVAYIRGNAAADLCNLMKREILPTNPSHVYVNWVVSNCGTTGRLYLGQICCWRYKVGPQYVYVNNPECTQCEQPDCEHNNTSTQQTISPVTIRPVTAGPLVVDPNARLAAVKNAVSMQKSLDSERLHIPSAKRQSSTRMDQDEDEEVVKPLKDRREELIHHFEDGNMAKPLKGKRGLGFPIEDGEVAQPLRDRREEYIQPDHVEFLEEF